MLAREGGGWSGLYCPGDISDRWKAGRQVHRSRTGCARCPGMSTQKHLENKRQEKEAGLQKLPWKLQGKVISILNSSIWPAAHTELTPACGPRPAFRFLLLQSPRAPLQPYQNPGVTPWATETTYMGQAAASTLSSLALFTSRWKNGHPQGSIKDYAAHHSSPLE